MWEWEDPAVVVNLPGAAHLPMDDEEEIDIPEALAARTYSAVIEDIELERLSRLTSRPASVMGVEVSHPKVRCPSREFLMTTNQLRTDSGFAPTLFPSLRPEGIAEEDEPKPAQKGARRGWRNLRLVLEAAKGFSSSVSKKGDNVKERRAQSASAVPRKRRLSKMERLERRELPSIDLKGRTSPTSGRLKSSRSSRPDDAFSIEVTEREREMHEKFTKYRRQNKPWTREQIREVNQELYSKYLQHFQD